MAIVNDEAPAEVDYPTDQQPVPEGTEETEGTSLFTPIPVPEPTPSVARVTNVAPIGELPPLPAPPTPPPGLDIPLPPAPPVLSLSPVLTPDTPPAVVPEPTQSVESAASPEPTLQFVGAPDLAGPELEPLALDEPPVDAPSEEELRHLISQHTMPEAALPALPIEPDAPVEAALPEAALPEAAVPETALPETVLPTAPPPPPPPPAPTDLALPPPPTSDELAAAYPEPVVEADGWPGGALAGTSTDGPAWDEPVPTLVAPETTPASPPPPEQAPVFSTPPPDTPVPTTTEPSAVYTPSPTAQPVVDDSPWAIGETPEAAGVGLFDGVVPRVDPASALDSWSLGDDPTAATPTDSFGLGEPDATAWDDIAAPPESDQALFPPAATAPMAVPQPTAESYPTADTTPTTATDTENSFFAFDETSEETPKRQSFLGRLMSKKEPEKPAAPLCPSCGGNARVDIDTANIDSRHLSCPSCSAMWTEPRVSA